MVSFHIDEYTIKKHFLMVFVCLLLGAIAFLYLQGERIFIAASGWEMKTAVFISKTRRHNIVPSYISVIDARAPKDSLLLYHNDPFEFIVSYPSRYLVGEEGGEGSNTAYFTKRQDPPFYLKSSPQIYSEEGDWRAYLARAEQRKDSRIVSVRSITVGDSIFAKEIISGMRQGTERIKEVVFGRSGNTYVILQRYSSAIDPAYLLLVKTFQFE